MSSKESGSRPPRAGRGGFSSDEKSRNLAAKQREKLWHLLGDFPEDGVLASRLLKEERRGGYVLETLLLDLNGIEPVPAYFAKPVNKKGPFPLVVVNHSHGGNYTRGRKELLEGSAYLQQPPYAEVLTELGCAVCCIDMWGFHERSGKSEHELVKEMLWQGRVLWGMMLYDSRRLIDYVCTRDDVDQARLATVGMSMGGLMAWWLGALDERIGAVVDLCAQVDSATLMAKRGLDHHGFYYYVPGLLKHFTTLDIQNLITPRPRISLTGIHDRLCPPEGVRLLDQGLQEAYAAAGHPERWHSIMTGGGHMETAEMRADWLAFLQRHLLGCTN